MSFIPFFILKTMYEESFYLKRSARVLVVPLLSFRAYARNPPVSEPEMELVIPNEYEDYRRLSWREILHCTSFRSE